MGLRSAGMSEVDIRSSISVSKQEGCWGWINAASTSYL
jgi:hypothetical protein